VGGGRQAEDAYKHALEVIELYGPIFSDPTN
jgi:hypothetical protein